MTCLLPGTRTQDEAAEDPLTAAQLGLTPNYELYWTNKFQVTKLRMLPMQMQRLSC